MLLSAMWRSVVALAVCAALMLQAANGAAAEEGSAVSRFVDPDDGRFDISGFLDTAYGFVPLLAPITEPAVGYGAVGALVFIDRHAPGAGQLHSRPNIAAIGGLGTENGTRGLFAMHLGTWLDGRLRTVAGLADADINLEFFGLGGDRAPGDAGFGYSVAARGGVVGASYRLGKTSLWLGARYALAETRVGVTGPAPPEVTPADFGLRLAGVVPSLTLDMRDNFFTPTDGWYADLSMPLFRGAFGSDRDFRKVTLTAMHYRQLARPVFLSLRASAKTSSDGTPFYLRPYVSLRGVQALRYQGAKAGEMEAELRWQFAPRFSVVGFAGAGTARTDSVLRDRDRSMRAGGAGVRYLLARKHGLHMGIDVASGPDQTVFYMIFGNAWVRP